MAGTALWATSFRIRFAAVCFLSLSVVAGLGVGAPVLAGGSSVAPLGLTVNARAVPAPAGARGLCRSYGWACAHSGTAARLTQPHLDTVSRINSQVNRRVRQVADQAQYRAAERWTLPSARGGDCEDIALLKKRDLIAAGIAPERLLLASVLDRQSQSHAVLVLRTDHGFYVLDNMTSRIKLWHETGYTFVRMQNPKAPSTWIAVFAGGILNG